MGQTGVYVREIEKLNYKQYCNVKNSNISHRGHYRNVLSTENFVRMTLVWDRRNKNFMLAGQNETFIPTIRRHGHMHKILNACSTLFPDRRLGFLQYLLIFCLFEDLSTAIFFVMLMLS